MANKDKRRCRSRQARTKAWFAQPTESVSPTAIKRGHEWRFSLWACNECGKEVQNAKGLNLEPRLPEGWTDLGDDVHKCERCSKTT